MFCGFWFFVLFLFSIFKKGKVTLPARTAWDISMLEDELWIPGVQWEMVVSRWGGVGGCTLSFNELVIPPS